ncbi:MAG: xanthine dehydrogenase family protein subunit M [bacterium]
MKPAPFDYAAPASLAEAASLLAAADGEAKILAGGQSLMPLLNMRLARPRLLVDIARVPALDYVREENGAIAVGAMTRQRTLERSPLATRATPLLHEAMLHIAHPQNRNQGTVCGSLAHADPAAELPAVALALDATFRVVGPNGAREIAARDFFVTYLTTSMETTEVLAEVRFPAQPARTGWAFEEVARRHGDFAMCGVTTTVTLDPGGTCSAARVVLFGVGSTPIRASAAEAALVGARASDKLFAEAARVDDAIDEPLSDVHATAEYRRHVAQALTARALPQAFARAAR